MSDAEHEEQAVTSDSLPAAWVEVNLGSILPLKYGKSLPARERNRDGDVPVYGSSGIVGCHDVALTSGPTIVVGRKGSAGEVHLSWQPCWPIDTAYYIDQFRGFNAEFFAHFLSHLSLGKLDQSTAIPSLSRDNYNPLSAPVPPVAEQNRIVAKLDELFSRIDKGEENLKRVRALVKQYRQSVLKAAVTGELTRDWREKNAGKGETGADLLTQILAARRAAWEDAERAKMTAKGKPPKDDKWKQRYKEPQPPDMTDLPDLPEGWVWATTDQITSLVQYGTSSKCDSRDDGIPVLRMGNIVDGELDFGSLKYLPRQHEEFPELLLEKGDLLFNRTNSAELVGKSAVYDGQLGACSFASYLIRVRTIEINAKWLATYINSVFGRSWIESVKSQQVGQANVNGSKLKSLRVPLPPKAEVEATIQRLEEAHSISDAAYRGVSTQFDKSNGLRQSVLRAAFSGNLVPQDPKNEPASALLERIAAERAAMPMEKPKPRRRRKPQRAMV